MDLQRVSLGFPLLLFFFRTIVGAVYVADVVAVHSISMAKQKGWSVTIAQAIDKMTCLFENRFYILTVNFFGRNTESSRTRQDFASGSLCKMRVLVVKIIFAKNTDLTKLTGF